MHGAANKFEFVASALRRVAAQLPRRPRLLDVGCRGCELSAFVGDFADYEGLDLFQNAQGSVRHVLDVSRGMPFEDSEFDFVVGLDVLEHVDDFIGTLRELWRVSGSRLVLILPNMAHVLHRLRFLRTGRISPKYDLQYGAGPDRHRWFTVLDQSDRYIHEFCTENGLTLEILWLNDTKKKDRAARVARRLGFSAQAVVWASVYVISRSGDLR